MGKRVIILDADFGLANIEIMFGTVPKHNLCDLIYQGKNIKDIITWALRVLDLFPADQAFQVCIISAEIIWFTLL